MPPAAMASSDSRAASRAAWSPVRRWWRSSVSIDIVCGNFGARPKPPSRWSTWASRALAAAVSTSAPGRLGGGHELLAGGDGLGDLGGLLLEVAALGAPQLVDALAQLGEAHVPAAGQLREVGAGEERPPVGEGEHGHRPAARAGHGLHRVHVDGVDVGPLLAVDLDAHEQAVDQRADLVVLERLVGHDVAPVARRVADRHQHRARRGAGPRPTPPRPTGTSRPGCRRAGAGTGWSRSRGGSA